MPAWKILLTFWEVIHYQVERSMQCLIRLPCTFAISMFLTILSSVQPNSHMQLSIKTTHWKLGHCRYLEKYHHLFSKDRDNVWSFSNLLFVAHSPPFHWVACLVDSENKLVWFGDGLCRPPPSDFINGLSKWLQEGFGFGFTVLEDLQCGMKNDIWT